MSNSQPKINKEQCSWEDIPSPPPPLAKYSMNDMLHLTGREFLSNAMNFGARNVFISMMVLPDFDGGAPTKWLVCASDAEPFENIDMIARKGCEPNQSAFKGESLHGFGLLFQTSLLYLRKPSLVIASMCEDHQFSAVYANEDQGGTRLSRRVASSWAFEVLDYKLNSNTWRNNANSKVSWYDKWSVICMFRLPDVIEEGNLQHSKNTIGDRLMCLPWTTGGDYIRTANDKSRPGISVKYCEKVMGLHDKYKNNGGNQGRKLTSKEAYIDRFRGDGAFFDIPTEGAAELPMQGEGVENIIIKGRIKVHHFPVKARPKKGGGDAGGWLENLRDIPQRKAIKGKGGEAGKKLTQKVFGLFSALYDDKKPGRGRFKNQAVYLGGSDPSPFLREMLLPETYKLGDWFFVVEIDIEEVCDKDGKRLNALQVSKCLGRVSNQTFGEKESFRQILLCAMRNVSHDDPERQRLSDYIKQMYPRKKSGFPTLTLLLADGDSGTNGTGRSPRWRVFDADSGERMVHNKVVNPGESLSVAVFDTVDNTWCGHQISGGAGCFDIEEITKQRTGGRRFGVTDEMVAGIEKLEAISPGVHVFGITVHKLSKLDDDGVWQSIEPNEYRPNNREFRPMRTVRVTIGNEVVPEFVKVCKVDVPTPDREGGEWGDRKNGAGGGDGRKKRDLQPVCWRDKGFFCRWDTKAGVDGHIMLNGHDMWVERYICNTVDQTAVYAEEIIRYLNKHAEALVNPMANYSLRPEDELDSSPGEDGWGPDVDLIVNRYLRTILDDDYIKTRIDKISKVFARLEESSDEECVKYANDPTAVKKNETAEKV